MTRTQLSTPQEARPSGRRKDGVTVRRSLEDLLGTLQPGDVFPTYRELMRRLDASSHTVMRALADLEREGKIIRRQGAGTFVSGPNFRDGHDSHLAHHPLRPVSEPPFAASLVNAQTIVAISKPDRAYFDRAVSLLYDHVEAAGLNLVFRFLNPEVDMVTSPPADQQCQGYILFRQDTAMLAKQLQDAGCRVVLVGAPLTDATFEVPNIHGDHAQGGFLAVRHLVELGHRNILFAEDEGSFDLRQTHRWRGHERALREAHKAGHETQTTLLDMPERDRWKENPALVREYFGRPGAPSAVVEWNDRGAMEMVGLLSRAGLQVPRDVSVMGYDDLPEGRKIHPALTTVETGLDQILDAALGLLTRPVAPSPGYSLAITPTLVRRESTGPPPTST